MHADVYLLDRFLFSKLLLTLCFTLSIYALPFPCSPDVLIIIWPSWVILFSDWPIERKEVLGCISVLGCCWLQEACGRCMQKAIVWPNMHLVWQRLLLDHWFLS